MKFAFLDRGDWRIQIYFSLMKELVEQGNDVVIFRAGWAGRWAKRPISRFSKIASKWGVRPFTQALAIKQGYTIISDQDFLKAKGACKGKFVGAMQYVEQRRCVRPWTDAILNKIYSASNLPFTRPIISFGYFTTGHSISISFAYPPSSLFVGDYVEDGRSGSYYLKNWSFAKHAASKISKTEARQVLGLPSRGKILAITHVDRINDKEQLPAVHRVAAKYKKLGYFVVIKTKGGREDMAGGAIDMHIKALYSDRPCPPVLELFKAADVVYSYSYHGPSNLVRALDVPHIIENPRALFKALRWQERHLETVPPLAAPLGDPLKTLLPLGALSVEEPLGSFASRSLANRFNYTYKQFMSKVAEWKKEAGDG